MEEMNSVVQGLPCSGRSVWSQMAYNISNAIEKVNTWSHKYVFSRFWREPSGREG